MREPTWNKPPRPARLRLESLDAPLRAMAREQSGDELLLEAELPWLKLGALVATELDDGVMQQGRVRWLGIDVTREGAARLRILVGPEGRVGDATPAEAFFEGAPAADACAVDPDALYAADGASTSASTSASASSAETAILTAPKRGRARALWTAVIGALVGLNVALVAVLLMQPPRAARLPALDVAEAPRTHRPLAVTIPRARPAPAAEGPRRLLARPKARKLSRL
jgi:hypothetical protein